MGDRLNFAALLRTILVPSIHFLFSRPLTSAKSLSQELSGRLSSHAIAAASFGSVAPANAAVAFGFGILGGYYADPYYSCDPYDPYYDPYYCAPGPNYGYYGPSVGFYDYSQASMGDIMADTAVDSVVVNVAASTEEAAEDFAAGLPLVVPAAVVTAGVEADTINFAIR